MLIYFIKLNEKVKVTQEKDLREENFDNFALRLSEQ